MTSYSTLFCVHLRVYDCLRCKYIEFSLICKRFLEFFRGMSKIVGRIKEYMDYKKISISAFEKSIGLSNASFNKTLKTGGAIGTDKLEKTLSVYTDINPQWLMTGEGQMLKEVNIQPVHTFALQTDRQIEVQDIPLYDLSATAGIMAIFNDLSVTPEDYLRVPNLPPVDGAIYVRGESMTPLLKSGDIIIYKKLALTLDSILWGQIYLLSFDAGGDTFTVVKYVQKSEDPEFIRLVSQNSRYEPKDIPISSIRALAIVKASITFHTIE